MIKKFKEMFNLQNKLNINTNGQNWTDGKTLQDRDINWHRCIYMESAEAIDSLNWKHWKDLSKKDDIENLKIELVDIWHFIMSQYIVDYGIDSASEKALKSFENCSSNESLIIILENIIRKSINNQTPIDEFFIAISNVDNFTMNDVYSLYIGKNCLNQFRQDNGYKEGSYIKIWSGEEDNVYMQKIIGENSSISYDELYLALDLKYKNVSC